MTQTHADYQLSQLDQLEAESIHIFREVASEFEKPVLMFSGGKDSIVLLRLAEKAFYPAKIPFPVLQADTGYDFPAVKDGRITLEKVEQKTPAPASGFIFNTRRPLFEDPRVREALAMAFDFEWANANLFNKAYRRTYGYYGGSELSSEGKPVDEAEKKVLGDAFAKLRPDFADG